MGEPLFLLQIVHAQSGAVAQMPGGGPMERDLRASLRTALQSRGVGLLRTEAHVLRDFDAALNEVIGGLKKEVRPLV